MQKDYSTYLENTPSAEGNFGEYGGAYLPPQLIGPMNDIHEAYLKISRSADFINELRAIRKHFQGRPTPTYHAKRISEQCGGAEIYLKREDLNHTGAHKLNHCMGEGLLAKYMGKKKLIAETGAGQHGVALATADSAFQAYLGDPETAIYCIGSVVGPHPFPMMVRDFQRVVGIEAREQFQEMTGGLPDVITACVGGGSNAMGLFSAFLNDPCEIWGVEPMGRGSDTGDHAATMTYGMPGIIHGFKCYLLQDEEGEPAPVYSIASGLDYPGVGPEHSHLKDEGRVQYTSATDKESLKAFFKLSRDEGIIPALESAHAVAFAMEKAKEMGRGSILVNLSGRGDKDLDFVSENYGFGD
jgi:tryptophan synthase beta chain